MKRRAKNEHTEISGLHHRGGAGEPDQGGGGAGLYPVRGQPQHQRSGGGAGLCPSEAEPGGNQTDRGRGTDDLPGAGPAGQCGAAEADGLVHSGSGKRYCADRGLYLRRCPLAACGAEGVPAGLSQGGLQAFKRRLPRCGAVAPGRKHRHRLCERALRPGLRVYPADGGQAAGHFAPGQPL